MLQSVTSTRVGNNLVVALPSDLTDSTMEQVRSVALEHVHREPTQAVIFECSSVHYMDRQEFEQLSALFRVVSVLGAQACLVGLGPGIVKYLVMANVDSSGLLAFLDLNEALGHFPAPASGQADHGAQ